MVLAGMREILRQREEELEKTKRSNEEKQRRHADEITGKEWIIRELSGEIGHLKDSMA